MEEKKELTLPKAVVIASVIIGGAMVIAPIAAQSHKMAQCVSAFEKADGKKRVENESSCILHMKY